MEITAAQQVYKTKEVAEILRVSIYTIHNLRKAGRLVGFTLAKHGQWRITKEELSKFMEGDKK
jgi:predicted site-specific integrase-resolvase